jgi:hypothetical protein
VKITSFVAVNFASKCDLLYTALTVLMCLERVRVKRGGGGGGRGGGGVGGGGKREATTECEL